MLTIEQFHDKKLADVYMKQYVDDPLSYQGMLLTICDREPEREAEALKTMEAHIRQFNRLYARGENYEISKFAFALMMRQ